MIPGIKGNHAMIDYRTQGFDRIDNRRLTPLFRV
jgi:hypothetical protein